LDKKLRKFQDRHVDCFPRKTVFLFCWLKYYYFFFSVFCCAGHVGFSLDVIQDCIKCLDEFVEFVESNLKEQ
jgi:hypothetical protein